MVGDRAVGKVCTDLHSTSTLKHLLTCASDLRAPFIYSRSTTWRILANIVRTIKNLAALRIEILTIGRECIGSYGATLDINSQRRSLEVLDAAPGVEVDRRRNLYSEVDLILILFSVTGPTSLESVKTIVSVECNVWRDGDSR